MLNTTFTCPLYNFESFLASICALVGVISVKVNCDQLRSLAFEFSSTTID
jgi:hypothetical protein